MYSKIRDLHNVADAVSDRTAPDSVVNQEIDSACRDVPGYRSLDYAGSSENALVLVSLLAGTRVRVLIDSDPDRSPEWRCLIRLSGEDGTSAQGLTHHSMARAILRALFAHIANQCSHTWTPAMASYGMYCGTCGVFSTAVFDGDDPVEKVVNQKSIIDVIDTPEAPKGSQRFRGELGELYHWASQHIDRTPKLPCAVTDMTPREFKIFEVTAYACGFGLFIRDLLHARLVREQSESVTDALNAAAEAIGTWVCTYASDMCSEEDVVEAQNRIAEGGGTLAYTAEVGRRIQNAIDDIKGRKDV
jgi:hypothetical protein